MCISQVILISLLKKNILNYIVTVNYWFLRMTTPKDSIANRTNATINVGPRETETY